MKLNADIIYRELTRHYNADISGPRNESLTISRPEFYMESEFVFQSGHLYLATVEHLPQRPRMQEDCVLVCIGENFTLNHYRDNLCLITIKSRSDFFKVYQLLQSIYDKYDSWENTLLNDLISSPDAEKLLSDSSEIFGRPLYLLDKSFKVVTSTAAFQESAWASTGTGTLNAESLSKFLSASDLRTNEKSALKVNIYGNRSLCVNLFSKYDQYIGCLVVAYENDDFSDGDSALAEFLAKFLQTAMERNPSVLYDPDSSIRKAMQNLVEEQPLSYSQRLLINSSNRMTVYRCVYLRFNRMNNQLPLSYICDILEDTFADSPAFIHDNAVLAFINTGRLCSAAQDQPSEYLPVLNEKLRHLAEQMGMYAGISNEFSDIFSIRVYYLQARSASENGTLLAPQGTLFYFESYALTEMVINSLGGLPPEAYYPAGFASLLEHDKDGGISYLQTLTAFLEENMSYTATAKRLYIHRSTLIDRISRIERELGIDLRDSDRRLQLEILLKAISIEELMRSN
ncbi:MAG: helix-turn-helix domain-containing protein [Mogibacterium sp.]|nr:helix-turn-helix domain-containing protein [Mogibacterium sp.]